MANDNNLVSLADRTTEEQRQIAIQGGIASGKARREKKTMAEALRKYLDEKDASGLTKRDLIAARVLKRIFDDGDIRDVKVLSEILGELTQKIDIEQLPTILQVNSKETKDKLAKVLKDNADD